MKQIKFEFPSNDIELIQDCIKDFEIRGYKLISKKELSTGKTELVFEKE